MHLSWVIVAASQSQSGDSSLVTFSYILGSIVAVMGIIGGCYRFYNKQKQRWIEDGEARARQSQIIQANTEMLNDMKKSIDDFMAIVRTELAGITARITHLERRRPGGS